MGIRQRYPAKTASQRLARELARQELTMKQKLVAARKRAGLEQVDVARLMGVDKSTISRFERIDSNPTVSAINQYAHAIGALVKFDVVPGWTATSEVQEQVSRYVDPEELLAGTALPGSHGLDVSDLSFAVQTGASQ